ncbi:MAG: flavodoxin domain-containing protein [Chloroflexota bacterium]
MNALIVYDTVYGNTEKVALAIAEGLKPSIPARLEKAGQAREIRLAGAALLIVGGPTHMGGMSEPLRAIVAATQKGALRGVSVAAFDTRYHVPIEESGSAAEKVAPALRELGGELLVRPESFFVVGAEGPLEAGEIERAAKWGADVAAKARQG